MGGGGFLLLGAVVANLVTAYTYSPSHGEGTHSTIGSMPSQRHASQSAAPPSPPHSSAIGLSSSSGAASHRDNTSIRSIKRLPLTDDGQVRQSGTERPDRPGAGELGRRVAEGLPVTERTGTFFRWELFNALDHWNYWGSEGDMTSSGFGQVTTTTDPPTEQVMLRLTF
jgi:hypothetical protein